MPKNLKAIVVVIILSCTLSQAFASDAPYEVVGSEVLVRTEKSIILGRYVKASPPAVVFAKDVKILECNFQGKKCKGPRISLEWNGRAPSSPDEATLKVTYQDGTKKDSLEVRLFPENFPWMQIKGKSVSSDPVVFSVSSITRADRVSCHLFSLSGEGEIIFYEYFPKFCGDFRPHRLGRNVFYSYSDINEIVNYVGFIGPRVILDSEFNKIRTIDLPLDSHEFIMLGDNHFISFEFELGRLKNGHPYLNKRIRERKDGKIIFDWGVSDFFRETNSETAMNSFLTTFRGETVVELHHLNSIHLLKNNKMLVGLGFDGVALLDRKEGKLDWVLGGVNDSFNLPMDQQPLFNHSASYDEKTNSVYLLSNRSWGKFGKTFTRVLKYNLDPKEKKLKSFTVLRDKKEVVYLLGSLEVRGKYLNIGFGTKETAEYDFLEVDFKGKETFSITMDKDWSVYRFYRLPSL